MPHVVSGWIVESGGRNFNAGRGKKSGLERVLKIERRCIAVSYTHLDVYKRQEEGAPDGRILVDLRYAPAETEMMRLFRLSGGEAFNGKGMLLWQAVLAFELFTAGAGKGAPLETMRRAIDLQ